MKKQTEQEAKAANAQEWAQSLSAHEISRLLLEGRNCGPVLSAVERAALVAEEKRRKEHMPSDREIVSMVHALFQSGQNREADNIAACVASKMRLPGPTTPEFRTHVEQRLKALVKSGDLIRIKFLPGRPFYSI